MFGISIAITILAFVIILLTVLIIVFSGKNNKNSNISEWSYQRYAKFYDETVLPDVEFDTKISIIKEMLLERNMTDISEIAEISGCTFYECVLKIMYLENKRLIPNYYINEKAGIIERCSEEDEELIKEYTKYFYYQHLQIDEIVRARTTTTISTFQKSKETVIKDVKYLLEKNLIHGVKYNEVDDKIIYYSLEKHKKEKDFVTINCSHCGAINDVPRNGKCRCSYCNCIIEDTDTEKQLQK